MTPDRPAAAAKGRRATVLRVRKSTSPAGARTTARAIMAPRTIAATGAAAAPSARSDSIFFRLRRKLGILIPYVEMLADALLFPFYCRERRNIRHRRVTACVMDFWKS